MAAAGRMYCQNHRRPAADVDDGGWPAWRRTVLPVIELGGRVVWSIDVQATEPFGTPLHWSSRRAA